MDLPLQGRAACVTERTENVREEGVRERVMKEIGHRDASRDV